MSEDKNVESTLDPSQRLLQVQEFAPRLLDLRVVELGKLVARRMRPQIVPAGFVVASALCIEDLKRGIDSFTQKPIDSTLLRQPQPAYVYDYLYLNIPTLASIAFSKVFADEVRTLTAAVVAQAGLEEDEWVLSPIITLEQAQADIIDNAKKKVLGLDWAHFGLGDKKEEIGQVYDASSRLILRNAGMNFPLKILGEDQYKEAILLKRINVEEATFIRDWLFLKAPESVAAKYKLSSEDVSKYFVSSDKSFLKAGLRANYYLTNSASAG